MIWVDSTAKGELYFSISSFRIVPDPNKADAILRGAVVNYISYPTIFDPVTGRAAAVQMHVACPRIDARDRARYEDLGTEPSRLLQRTTRQLVAGHA